ncbi:MAG: hypothetical protein ACJ8F3_15920 [Xanthobacteraceae bacterium]
MLGLLSRVRAMAACGMSMMGGFLVLSAVMMLRRFSVVACGMGMMLGCLPVVFRCFLGHDRSSSKEKSPAGQPG